MLYISLALDCEKYVTIKKKYGAQQRGIKLQYCVFLME
jgi:hypothetical protein